MAHGPQLVDGTAALGVLVLAPAATGPGDLQCGFGCVSEKNLGRSLEGRRGRWELAGTIGRLRRRWDKRMAKGLPE